MTTYFMLLIKLFKWYVLFKNLVEKKTANQAFVTLRKLIINENTLGPRTSTKE